MPCLTTKYFNSSKVIQVQANHRVCCDFYLFKHIQYPCNFNYKNVLHFINYFLKALRIIYVYTHLKLSGLRIVTFNSKSKGENSKRDRN